MVNFTKYSNKRYAFTLAELLITLAVIGVVTAITIPTVVNDSRKNQYRTQFKKAYNQFVRAYNLAKFDLGGNPACYYWSSKEAREKYLSYDPSKLSTSRTDEDGDGFRETYTITYDGKVINTLPGDVNGGEADCNKQTETILSKYNIVDVCDQQRIPNSKNNCAPYYIGYEDFIAKEAASTNKDNYNNKTETEKEIYIKDQSQGAGIKRDVLNKRKVYHLSDGSSIIFQTGKIIIFDVNGDKGPNKWGHDVFNFYLVGDPTGKSNKIKCYLDFVENRKSAGGGYTCDEMMKNIK